MKYLNIGFVNLLAALVLFVMTSISHAVTIHSTDFINDGNRDYFNGFESLPETPTTTTNYGYVENNIRVEQIVNPNFFDRFPQIWYANLPGDYEGSNAWYPNGGDYGYTEISLENGNSFSNIGLLVGTGNTVTTTSILFELYNDNILVASGNVDYEFDYQYLGFSGGIFDTLLIRNTTANPDSVSFLDGNLNLLAIDSIEVNSVPISSVLYLFIFGLVSLTRKNNKI